MNDPELKKSQPIKIKRWKIMATTFVIIIIGVYLMLPGINGGPAHPQMQCMNNLRWIGIANLDYAAENSDSLPISYISDSKGNKLLSWRYSLLDLLDNVYLKKAIDPLQAWDSVANQKYSEFHILVFKCPTDELVPENGTSFFTITGEETLFPEGSSVTLDQISEADGLMSTIMLTEAADMNIHWLEPMDIPFSNVNNRPREMNGTGPSSHHQHSFNVFYADGHASSISKDVDPKVLRALITWNGCEEVPEEF